MARTEAGETDVESLSREVLAGDPTAISAALALVEAVSYTHLTLPTICSV